MHTLLLIFAFYRIDNGTNSLGLYSGSRAHCSRCCCSALTSLFSNVNTPSSLLRRGGIGLMYPRMEVFYVRTTILLIRPERNRLRAHLLAVRVELARLWYCLYLRFWQWLFSCFSVWWPHEVHFLKLVFSSRFAFIGKLRFCLYPSILVLVLLSAVEGEKVMKDAEASSARSSPSLIVGADDRVVVPTFIGRTREIRMDLVYLGWFTR